MKNYNVEDIIKSIIEDFEKNISIALLFFYGFHYNDLLQWKRAAYELDCLGVAQAIEDIEAIIRIDKSNIVNAKMSFNDKWKEDKAYHASYERIRNRRAKEKKNNPNVVYFTTVKEEVMRNKKLTGTDKK